MVTSVQSVIGWCGACQDEYTTLCDRFNQLTVATTQNSLGLARWCRRRDETVLMFSQQAQAYFTRFELYTVSLGQCVQAGLFDALSDDVVRHGEARSSIEVPFFVFTHEKPQFLHSTMFLMATDPHLIKSRGKETRIVPAFNRARRAQPRQRAH